MAYATKKKLSNNSVVPLGSNLYGTCSTASGTVQKTVDMPDFNVLVEGVTIHVYFSNKNTANSPTLKVGSTSAVSIKRNGSLGGAWENGSVISFTYDGTNWVQNDADDGSGTTYGLSYNTSTRLLSLVEGGSTSSVTITDKDTTYTLTISGNTLTLTPSEGTPQSVTIPDTNTTYTIGISGDVITLTGSDGSTSTVTVVPTTRKVNGKALSTDIDLSASDVGAVPTTRKVNNKALSSDITLSASDVSALPISGGTVTGATTINDLLTLYREGTTANNYPAGIRFKVKDTTTGKTYDAGYLYAYQDHGATPYGVNFVLNGGGGLFIGSGESPGSHYSAKGASYNGEDTFITSDGSVFVQGNGNTIANRLGFKLDASHQIVPCRAETATNNVGSIGTNDYKWANLYVTNINGVAVGTSPKFTDTNTHRPIQMNGTEILGNNTTVLNLKAGSNVSLSNSSGTVTIAATDTTYSSKAAASGGTAVSLVTTGEKYTWNSKASKSDFDDYVVAHGKSGIWGYRKWNSGYAECWGTYTTSIAITTASAAYGGYRSGQITAPNYPFTFTASPNITATSYNGGGHWVNNLGGSNATRPQFYLSAGTSMAAANRSVSFYASGTWK